MTNWIDFNILSQNLVAYITGSYALLGIGVTVFFMLALVMVGMEFKYALPLSLPVFAGFVVAGWFGPGSWVLNAALIIVAVIYGVALVRLANV